MLNASELRSAATYYMVKSIATDTSDFDVGFYHSPSHTRIVLARISSTRIRNWKEPRSRKAISYSFEMSSPSPQASPVPIPSPSDGKSPARRTSFGFLHRSKSKEPLTNRKASGGKITKRQHEQARDEELKRLQEANLSPNSIPRLPDLTPSPQLQTFGGENSMSDATEKGTKRSTEALSPNVPMPPIPGKSQSAEALDPYARSESMTHRGRYSYAPSAVSSIDSPRRVRRRKDPTPYK